MADFRWNPIEAPRLDTRDVALAGQQMDSAFGRFTDLLNARDARLNKKATDAGAAQLMAAQTPEALALLQAQAAAGGFGDRADMRDILTVGNQRQEAMLQNAVRQQQVDIGQEDLHSKQDLSQFQPLYSGITEALNVGDRAKADALTKELLAAGGGRNLYKVRQDGEELFNGYRKFEQDKLESTSRMSNDSARTGMAQTEFNQTQQDRLDLTNADELGVAAASGYRLEDKATAQGKLHATENYRTMTGPARARADQSFDASYDQLTGKTGSTDAAFAKSNALAGGVVSDLDAQKNRLINAQKQPMAVAVRESQAAQDTVKLNDAVQTLQSFTPNWTYNSTEADLKAQMEKHPGTQYSDFVAAAKNFRTETGKWSSLKPGGQSAAWNDIGAKAKEIADRRGKGYGQNDAVDLARDTAPLEATKTALTNLQDQLVRYERAAREAPLSRAEQAAYDEKRAKYEAMLAGSQKRTGSGSTGSW